MFKSILAFFCVVLCGVNFVCGADDVAAVKLQKAGAEYCAMNTASVLKAMALAADWQMANPSRHKPYDWTQGAYYCGLAALAGIAGDGKYSDELLRVAKVCEWKPGPRKYHADDHCVCQAFIDLYQKNNTPGMLDPTISRFDEIIAEPRDGDLDFSKKGASDKWSWCDSLFMAPPAWTMLAHVTGDAKYLDYMDRHWWLTSDYLFDKEECLYFRDSNYFDRKEANGRKVFWGRGNGWVIGGLVRVLQYLPEKHPSRKKYIRQYKQMMEKIASLQGDDGFWHASLLDPASYPAPETSSSGFFVYGLAWGVNNGILDAKKYRPAVEKGWQGLTGHLAADGMLCWVQAIGSDPKGVKESDTEVYGVGAFLLAGSEVFKMCAMDTDKKVKVKVTNKLPFLRTAETVELPFKTLLKCFGGLDSQRIVVMDGKSSRILPVQVVFDYQGKPEKFLFQVDVSASASRELDLLLVDGAFPMPQFSSRAFSMFVPQRKDDFAWENDRTAYRMYGPALQNTPGENSGSGVDVWVKKVARLVVKDLYAKGDYHKDHGEGLDFYKVGTSRGCGGTAIKSADKYYNSANYVKWNIIANGPIRTQFELSYDTWLAGGRSVSELKTISLDAGSFLSKFESHFITTSSEKLTAAVGIAIRKTGGTSKFDADKGWMSYAEPEDPANGIIKCGVVLNPDHDAKSDTTLTDQCLVSDVGKKADLVYYAGSSWSKAGYFASADDWNRYLDDFRARLGSPLKVKIID